MGDARDSKSVVEGHLVDSAVVNRRTVLNGTAALGVGGLVTARHPFHGSRVAALPTALPAATPTYATGRLSLPMLGDGMNMDRPEYYETLQAGQRPQHHNRLSADVNGDGQDELIVRGPGGILAYVFDPDTGQWFTLPGTGPAWSDAKGWDQPQYYETIMTADLDGDGRAELLGLGPNGLEVWRYSTSRGTWVEATAGFKPAGSWSTPWYYSTLQCGDIDGDGRDELVGRTADGIHAWRWTGSTWVELPRPAGFTDATLWFMPQYYETIQLADVNGDGRAELLGRGPAGMVTWGFNGTGWAALPTNTDLSDGKGWSVPTYFMTIQCADIDGDGAAELIGMSGNGVQAWRLTSAGWSALSTLTVINLQGGWPAPQYALTIQGADIDGDGRAELLARGAGGIRVWKLTGSGTGQWQEMASGPGWSNAAGWTHSQYFLTIQTARVRNSGGNTNNSSPSPSGIAAVVLGRSATSVETWRYGTSGSWTPTSRPWPSMDPVAYVAVSKFLGVLDPNGVRALYSDQTIPFDLYFELLMSDPPPAPPPDYTGKDTGWYDAVAQIALELTYVQAVQSWFTLEHDLLDDIFLGNAMSVDTVIAAMNAKVSDNSDVGLSILSLLFNAAWAVLGVPEKAEVASAIAGLAAVVVQGVATTWSSPTTLNTTIFTVKETLEDLFDSTVAQVDSQLPAITGGNTGNGVATGDYGLLQAIGSQILSGADAWTFVQEDMDTLAIAGQRSYAVSVWQMLEVPVDWRWSVEPYQFLGDPELNTYYGVQAVWDTGGDAGGCQEYLMVQYATELGFLPKPDPIASAVLQALHGKASATQVFPLGVPGTDVIRALHGWPQVKDTLAATNCDNVIDVYTLSGTSGSSSKAVAAATTSTASALRTVASGGGTATRPTLADRIAGRASSPSSSGLLSSAGLLPLAGGSGGSGKGGGNGTGNGTGSGTGEAKQETGSNPVPSPGVDLFVVTSLGRSTSGGIVATVQVHNRGLSPARDVEVVSAKLRGRRATGALPTRRRHIDDGEARSFHVHFVGVPGKAGTRVRFHLSGSYEGGTFSQNVQLTLP